MHALDTLIDEAQYLIDYTYDRMVTATDIGESEHYEALLARRVNRQAVLFARKEGH